MTLPRQCLEDAPASDDATDVLVWATDRFAGRIALVSSLGPTTLVVVDLLWRLGRTVPVLWIDTGLHFDETLALKERVEARYGPMIVVRPDQTVAEQAAAEGDRLWARDPDRCCALRKVAPLDRALTGYDAWIAGLRRDQGVTRAAIRTVERGERVKINPLATWTRADVDAYAREHDVPHNPLLDHGYPSVGCWPCTRPAAGSDERAGRWAGRAKTECGLHLPPNPNAAAPLWRIR